MNTIIIVIKYPIRIKLSKKLAKVSLKGAERTLASNLCHQKREQKDREIIHLPGFENLTRALKRNLFLEYPATATEPKDQFNARYEAETHTESK